MKTLLDFDRALARHDWTYEFSDDYGVWHRGKEANRALESAASTSPAHQTLFNAYRNCYVPLAPFPYARRDLHALRQSLGLPDAP